MSVTAHKREGMVLKGEYNQRLGVLQQKKAIASMDEGFGSRACKTRPTADTLRRGLWAAMGYGLWDGFIQDLAQRHGR